MAAMTGAQHHAAEFALHNQPASSEGARTTRPRCCGTTAKGAPCGSFLNLSESGFCLMHDPERAGERAAMRSAGGAAAKVAKTKSKAADPATTPPRMKSLADAVSVASWIADAVLRGDIDARTSEAATKAVRQFQLGEEKASLLKRISALEAQLKAAAKVAA